MTRKLGFMRISVKHWLPVVIVFMLVGCSRFLTPVETDQTAYQNNVIQNISDNYLEYSSLTSKLKIDATIGGQEQNLKGQLRIKKDSIVWISIHLNSGLPILKAVFMKDTFIIHDRINKAAYVGNYQELKSRFQITTNYHAIQSILLNELWLADLGRINIMEKELEKEPYFLIESLLDQNQLSQYQVRKKNYKVSKLTHVTNEAILKVGYHGFEKIDQKLLPSFLTIDVKSNKTSFLVNIEMIKTQINKKQKYNIKLPKNLL
jgi:hypothetical protein